MISKKKSSNSFSLFFLPYLLLALSGCWGNRWGRIETKAPALLPTPSAEPQPTPSAEPLPTGGAVSLAYATNPATYEQGLQIQPNAPRLTGGSPLVFSVSPKLPVGISLDSATGVLSGTPLAAISATPFTVIAKGAFGSVQTTLTLTVKGPPAPTNLSYLRAKATYAVGIAIEKNTPSSQGGSITSYSVTPSLPAGLILDPTTGVISGTPMLESAATSYTVTGANSGGSSKASLSIQVNPAPPAALSYTSLKSVYPTGIPITNNLPFNSGGKITSYSVSPALPAGLTLNSSTGVLSGSPTTPKVAASYVITGSNVSGSAQATVSIEVIIAAPSNLTYSFTTASFPRNVAIGNLKPSNSGGAISSYSITPALPEGLSFDMKTGIISGTPKSASSATTYKVVGGNSTGSTQTSITLTIPLFKSLPQNITGKTQIAHNQVNSVYFDTDKIYAGTPYGLSISSDGGATWTTKTTANGLSSNTIRGIFANGNQIYVATNKGISISTNGGTTWVAKSGNGLGSSYVTGVYVSNGTIYASTNWGFSVSTNGGDSWINYRTEQGIADDNVNDVNVSDGAIYLATAGGVSISTDNGGSWTNYTSAQGLGSNSVKKIHVQENTIYAATEGGLSISSDGGKSWVNKTTANGLEENNLYGVHVSGKTIYVVAGFPGGLSISTDGGATWVTRKAEAGLGSLQISSVFAAGRSVFVGTMSGIAISQDGAASFVNKTNSSVYSSLGRVTGNGSSSLFAATSHGLWRSNDGGSTWSVYSGAGAPPKDSTVYDVYVTGTKIYAAAWDGVFVSTDDGVSWTKVFSANARRVFAYGSGIYAVNLSGLYVSSDSGNSWKTYTTNEGLCSNNMTGVYVTAAAIYVSSHSCVSISRDGGASWSNFSAKNGLKSGMVWDIHGVGNTVYAATLSGLSVTSDYGATWTHFTDANGLPTNWIGNVFANANAICVGTESGLSVSTTAGKSWTNYNTPHGLGSSFVLDCYSDGTSIFTATGGGLSSTAP